MHDRLSSLWRYLLNTESIPYVVFNGVLFGTTLIASRYGISQFDTVPYVLLRLVLASIAFAALLIYRHGLRFWPTERHLWRHGIILGITATALPTLFFVAALLYVSSGITAILSTTGPAITVLMAHFMLEGERVNWRKGIGVTLALGGALLLTVRGESGLTTGPANPLGYVLIITGIISISASSIYLRLHARSISSVQLTGIQTFVAMIVIMPLLLVQGITFSRVNTQGWLALLWGGIAGTFGAMLLYFYNIRRFGATPAALTSYIVPVVTAIGGYLLLGERVTTGMVVGMVIIVAGILILNTDKSGFPETTTAA